jgi:hypothetical protein
MIYNGILFSHKHILIHVTWVNLKNTMVREKSQSKKGIYYIFICGKARIGKFIETVSR